MKDYKLHRDAAIAWLASKRDFNRGIDILQKAGFRPVVVKVLARQGKAAPAAMERMASLMRAIIKAWQQPETTEPDTDIELGVVQGVEVGSLQNIDAPNSIFEAYEKADELPLSISEVVKRFRNSYMLREQLRRQLFEVGENNDEESVTKRKALSDAIAVQSDIQDKLYPMYAKFLETGELPSSTEVEVQQEQHRINIEKAASESELSALSKDELQKLRKSLATKVLRAKNMLLYQQESKAEKENPIPDDDLRRTKYESKIKRLSVRIEEIDKQIALLA